MSYNAYKNEPFYWAPTHKVGTRGGWIAHKDSPSPPPAPDYKGAAEAEAAANMEALKYQTQANRINQYSPWGSLTYTNTPTFDQAGYDRAMAEWNSKNSQGTWVPEHMEMVSLPGDGGTEMRKVGGYWSGATGDGEEAPSREKFMKEAWAQQLNLTPDAQKALDAQLAIQNARSTQAQTLLGQVKDAYATPFSYDGIMGSPTSMPTLNTSGIQALDQNAPGMQQVSAGNAPVWDDAARLQAQQAAFNYGKGMLDPQFQQQEDRLRNRLALQGLAPTTEAFNMDVGNFNRGRNEAYGQLANQSILTGNQMGIADYNAKLGGYNSQFGNNLAAAGANNASALSQFGANNSARTQALQNALSNYGAAMSGVQNQQMMRQLQLAEKLQMRDLPLNELNALLQGQQVTPPQFNGFAMTGNPGGTDYMGAMQGKASWDQGLYNAQAANASSQNSLLGTAAMAAAMFF